MWRGMAKCLQLFFFILTIELSNAYLAKDTNIKETPLQLIRVFPNYVNSNISEFRPLLYRIETNQIRNFNSSTMITVVTWVDEDTSSTFPVFISIIQKHERIAYELPYIFKSGSGTTVRYTSAARTICHHERLVETKDILISISTGSTQLIGFHMKVLIEDFHLNLGVQRNLTITPTTPRLLRVPFSVNASQNVLIKVSSNNDACMAIGIQGINCPILSLESDTSKEDWEMITRNGAIRVNMKNYLNGFFIKIEMHQNDGRCGSLLRIGDRRKKLISVVVENDLPMSLIEGQFWLQMSIPPLLGLLVGVVIGSLYLITYALSKRKMIACRTYNVNKAENKSVVGVQQFAQPRLVKSISYGKWIIVMFVIQAVPILWKTFHDWMDPNEKRCSFNAMCSHSLWIFKDFNHLWSNVGFPILGCCFLLVCKVKKFLQKNSEQDEGIQFFVDIYNAMGFSMICYGILSSAYHICPSEYTFQYDIMYLALITVICQLKLSESRRPNTLKIEFCATVLAVLFLLMSMGVEAERFLSDWELTFLVFRIIVAIAQGFFIFYASIYALYVGYPISRFSKKVKVEEIPLQQRMLSDIRPQQPVISLSSSGQRNQEESFVKSIGDIPRFLSIFPRIWHWKLPKFRFERCLYVLMLVALNSYLVYVSLTLNYCVYIFAFLGANFGLNLTYYVLMKIVFGEFSCTWKSLQVFIYLTLTVVAMSAAGFFFMQNIKEWTSPNHHRTNDEACSWLKPYGFYDKHDACHVLFSCAAFFMFMTILCIDDGVEGVSREYLLVF